MMGIFDSNHDVERKDSIFPEYNTNKYIDGQMIYVLGNDYKRNIIWGRYFNTLLIMIKYNNFYMEAAKDMMELIMICVIIYIPHAPYKDNVLEVHMNNTIGK